MKIISSNSFKKVAFIIIPLFFGATSPYAQKWAPFIGDKLSPLQQGKGFIVEDFPYFKNVVLENIITNYTTTISDEVKSERQTKADSLTKLLFEKGTISFPEPDMNMLSYFNIYTGETIVITNLTFSLNRMGGLKSLEYAIKKGDTITIMYKIIKGAGFDEFEVLEGKEVRYSLSKSKKNVAFESVLIASQDGVLAINLVNKGLLRSKGKLLITKKEAQKRISFKYQCDTLFNQVKIKKVFQDTLSELLLNQSVSIPSSGDITKSNKLTIPIPFASDKKYFAWAFWLGSKPNSKVEWENQINADPEKNPLKNYLLHELKRIAFFSLPEEKFSEIKFSLDEIDKSPIRNFQGKYLRTAHSQPSLNTRNNYASFSLNDAEKKSEGLSMTIKNSSNLYNYDVLVNVVGLFTNSFEAEEEITEKICQEYVTLSVL